MDSKFLEKDEKQKIGTITQLFESPKDVQEFLDFVGKIDTRKDLSAPQKRALFIKGMMDTDKYRRRLKYVMPAMFKEGLKNERGKEWKMSMKDIEKATGLSDKELIDPKTGWMGTDKDKAINSEDLRSLLDSEGLNYQDALKVLSEAQTQATRKKNWYDEPWYNRALMTFAAPLTADDLSKGKPVDGIYAADYVGMGSNVVPWGQVVKGLGTIGRTTADMAIPSILEGATSVVADDVPWDTAIENTGKNLAAGGAATGVLKSGAKGIGLIRGALTKEGKHIANASEELMKEGIYRVDLEKRIRDIKKKIARNERPSDDELELLNNFEMLQESGVDLSKLGHFSQDKLDSYLNALKTDPLKYTEKGKAKGTVAKDEDLFTRREKIKASVDPYEQFKFDNNPGTVTFTDLLLDNPNTKFKIDYETGMVVPDGDFLKKYGWGSKAGFGRAREDIKDVSLLNHPGITKEGRPSFAEQIVAGQKAGLTHTDPYFPRNLDVNKAAKEMMIKYPQLRPYFSKLHKDPTTRDFLFNNVIPYFWKRYYLNKPEPEKKDNEEE